VEDQRQGVFDRQARHPMEILEAPLHGREWLRVREIEGSRISNIEE
jgi:hypothetical protein